MMSDELPTPGHLVVPATVPSASINSVTPAPTDCDETDDPLSRHIETLANETQRLGLRSSGGSDQ